MKKLLLTAVVVAFALGGCAHPISLSPDLAAVAGSGQSKIDKRVGLVVSDEDKKAEVVTPGGGGDKVSYFPYRDLETAIYVALTESFTGVSRVAGPSDPKVQADGLQYIITPRILTTSSSPSLVTWPPTEFNILLTCKVVDRSGNAVTEVKVRGEGRAEFDEFKKDFSLASRRAGVDAVAKLIKAFGDSADLR